LSIDAYLNLDDHNLYVLYDFCSVLCVVSLFILVRVTFIFVTV